MTSVRRRTTDRLSAVLVASGLLVGGGISGAQQATAEEVSETPSGATATLDGLRTYDEAVISTKGRNLKTSAGLFEMGVEDGGTLQTYSVDALKPSQDQARYEEAPWKASPLHGNPQAGKIRWILKNSYPHVNDMRALASASGAKKLTPRTAAAGTQVAIWRHGEGATGARIKATDPSAERLANYLERKAKKLAEPKASLALEGGEVATAPGDRAGPVTLRSGVKEIAVEPAPDAASQGVKVVDANGEKIKSVADGDELYFDVPENVDPGNTSLTAQVSTKLPVGRVFTGIGEHGSSQAQILAGSSQSTVSATATAHWAAKGAIPAVTAEKNCAKGGLEIAVDNRGDDVFAFGLAGERHRIEAGDSEKITVPVEEDQPYKVSVSGPNGFDRTFSGVLDCETAGAVGVKAEQEPAPEVSPATVGGGGESPTDDGTDLADTGNSSNTPLIIGVAAVFVVVGGAAMLLVRKRVSPEEEAQAESASDVDGGGAAAEPPASSAPSVQEPAAAGAEERSQAAEPAGEKPVEEQREPSEGKTAPPEGEGVQEAAVEDRGAPGEATSGIDPDGADVPASGPANAAGGADQAVASEPEEDGVRPGCGDGERSDSEVSEAEAGTGEERSDGSSASGKPSEDEPR